MPVRRAFLRLRPVVRLPVLKRPLIGLGNTRLRWNLDDASTRTTHTWTTHYRHVDGHIAPRTKTGRHALQHTRRG